LWRKFSTDALGSPARGAFRGSGRRVHAIRLSVDELSAHEGDQREMYGQDVGYVLGE